jgi:hypothetical protein
MPYSCGAATHGVAARNRARMESIVFAERTFTACNYMRAAGWAARHQPGEVLQQAKP